VNFLELSEVIELQRRLISCTGGLLGVKHAGAVDSALAQPKMTFDGVELYPSLAEKAAALAYSLARNHGFEDGNKRIAHAAMELFLVLNGDELQGHIDDQEHTILALAAGALSREAFTAWVAAHIVPRSVPSPAIS
jgi:death-on-curing protein